MKAVVKPGPRRGVELADVPYPEVKAGKAIVAVKAAGICGSDLHIYNLTESGPTLPTFPHILGHEGAGEIVELASDREKLRIGDRVCYNPFVGRRNQFCGQCYFCLSGQPLGCRDRRTTGERGCMAEQVHVESTAVYRLPDSVPFDVGALVEPFAVSYHAVLEVANLEVGGSLVIQGPGTIGLSALISAKLKEPGLIVVTGTEADEKVRLKRARELGADVVVNVDREDPVETVRDLTDGRGVDVVVETVGVPLLQQGLRLLRFGGEFVAVGHPEGARPVTLNGQDYNEMIRGRKRILGSWIYDTVTWIRVLELLERGSIDLRPLITHRLPLQDALKGFDLSLAKDCVKVILEP